MLERYVLARDPWLFRNVVFIIDKFHLKNHSCSCSYAYYEYEECMVAYTEVCEQGPWCCPAAKSLPRHPPPDSPDTASQLSRRVTTDHRPSTSPSSSRVAFSHLRPILETTCKRGREDRLFLYMMLVQDEFSRDRDISTLRGMAAERMAAA
jgi:hypothetical protein